LESYFLNRLRKLKAYYISFGSGQQKENLDPKDILLKTSEIIESSRTTLQMEARKLLTGITGTGTTQPLISPAFKAKRHKASTPISFSPQVMQRQNSKCLNCNETPLEIKSVLNQNLMSPAYKLLLSPCKATTTVALSPQVMAQRNNKHSNKNPPLESFKADYSHGIISDNCVYQSPLCKAKRRAFLIRPKRLDLGNKMAAPKVSLQAAAP